MSNCIQNVGFVHLTNKTIYYLQFDKNEKKEKNIIGNISNIVHHRKHSVIIQN